MNKIFALVLLLQLFYFGATGQTTLNKVIDINGNADFGAAVVKTSSGFLINCAVGDFTTNKDYAGVIVLDNEGKLIKKHSFSFGENTILSNGRSLKLRNNNIAYYNTLQQYDTVKKDFTTWTALTLFDELGDTLWTKQYLDSSKHVSACTLIETPDSGIYLIGNEKKGATYNDPLITKVDTNGVVTSQHSILTPANTAIYSIVKHPNGKYYGGGYTTANNSNDPYVTELDTNMRPIWSKQYKSGVGKGAELFITEDRNLVFGTDTLIREHSPGLYWSRKQIFKIDTTGKVIWRKVHGETGEGDQYATIVGNSKNEIFALGRREPLEGIHYTLTKLSSEGDTIWMHQYAYEDIEGTNYLWDMVATDDGGVLMVGDVTPLASRYQDVWLVKTDSNGCVNNDCVKTLVYGKLVGQNEPFSTKNEISLYPNPTKGNKLWINGLDKEAHYQFAVTSISGKVVLKGKLDATGPLNISSLQTGNYLITVFEGSTVVTTKKLIVQDE